MLAKHKTLTMTLALAFTGLGVVQGCSTTGQVARVDKEKRRFELQSQDDTKSAMIMSDEATTKTMVEKFEARIKANPRDLNALINLAQTELAIGRYEKAEAVCRDALRIDLKNEMAKKLLAQIYYRRGNLEMAKIILNGIDAANSKDSQILNLLGMIALRQNQPDFALHSFNEALKNNPSDISVRMNLGVLYVHYRQLGLAAVEFERVLKVMPEHPDANLHLAIIESNRGNLDRAEDLNKKVLSNVKSNPVAIYNLAVLEHRRKKFDKSLDYLKTYLDTEFAKKKNNQEVFAMIDRIRNEKEALTGEKVSDDEIMKLAAKKGTGNSGGGDQEFVEADPRQQSNSGKSTTPKNAPASQTVETNAAEKAPNTEKPKASEPTARTPEKIEAPKKVEAKPDKKTKKYRNDDEEIEDLEKQLQ